MKTDANFNYTVTDIEEIKSDSGIEKIYPNPSAGLFAIELAEPLKDFECKVVDRSGRVVQEYVFYGFQKQLEIDLSDFPDGVYFLELIHEVKRTVKQIVKLGQ